MCVLLLKTIYYNLKFKVSVALGTGKEPRSFVQLFRKTFRCNHHWQYNHHNNGRQNHHHHKMLSPPNKYPMNIFIRNAIAGWGKFVTNISRFTQSCKNVPTSRCWYFPAGANFWARHANKCAIMSNAHITYTIAHWSNIICNNTVNISNNTVNCTMVSLGLCFLQLVLVTHC